MLFLLLSFGVSSLLAQDEGVANDCQSTYSQALNALHAGKYDTAIERGKRAYTCTENFPAAAGITGRAYLALLQVDSAEWWLSRALESGKIDIAEQTRCLNAQAELYLVSGYFSKARSACQRALEITTACSDCDSLRLSALLATAQYFDFRGREDSVEIYLTEARTLAGGERFIDHPLGIKLLEAEAFQMMATGQPDKAKLLLRRALELKRKELGDAHHQVGNSYRYLAELEIKLTNYPASKALVDSGAAILEAILPSDHPELFALEEQKLEARTMSNEAEALENMIGFLERKVVHAADYYGPESFSAAKAWIKLAEYYIIAGRYEEASVLTERGLDILRRFFPEDNEQFIVGYMQMARIAERLEAFDKANIFLEKTLILQRTYLNRNEVQLIQFYSNIVEVATDSTLRRQAAQYLFDLYRKVYGDNNVYANFYAYQLGLFEFASGDEMKGVQLMESGLSGLRPLLGKDNRIVLSFELTLYLLYCKGEKIKEGLEQLKSLFPRLVSNNARTELSKLEYGLAFAHLRLGVPDTALLYIESCLDRLNFTTEENYAEVEDRPTLLLALDKAADIHAALGRQNNAPGEIRQAIAYQEMAYRIAEDQRQKYLSQQDQLAYKSKYYRRTEQLLGYYLDLADLEKVKAPVGQMLATLEKTKYTVLVESLRRGRPRVMTRIPADLLELESAFNEDIRSIYRQLLGPNPPADEKQRRALELAGVAAKLRLDSLGQIFKEKHPDYFDLLYEQDKLNLSDLQKEVLLPGQTLLQYLLGDSSLFIFVIKQDFADVHRIAIGKDFREQVVRMMQNGILGYHGAPPSAQNERQRARAVEAFAESSSFLYDKLIAPVKEQLSPELIIVPDGILSYLPFEALPSVSSSQSTPDAEGRYLLEDHQISYAFSATLLRDVQRRSPDNIPTLSVLAMSPFAETFKPTTLQNGVEGRTERVTNPTALPWSKDEVQNVGQLFGGKVVMGPQATDAVFEALAPQSTIIHLATHGVADDREGEFSHLVLRNEEGGYLYFYVRDIYGLRLNAEMVVLSACSTNLGQLRRGEGIVGLSRAFTFAGAKSVLATLWQVDDRATAEIIGAFYTHLKAAGTSKAAALRQAKLDYLNANRSEVQGAPFFWAALVATGDMRPLE
ncbi:CHAT domain-containing protein [Neolewinella lacunae]|nr:CHAT domain-containing protein [Neolewinella lacunae]MDN3634010.1 CHAT domain-containing protein [Neolewinella lacunae]